MTKHKIPFWQTKLWALEKKLHSLQVKENAEVALILQVCVSFAQLFWERGTQLPGKSISLILKTTLSPVMALVRSFLRLQALGRDGDILFRVKVVLRTGDSSAEVAILCPSDATMGLCGLAASPRNALNWREPESWRCTAPSVFVCLHAQYF